MTGPDDARDDAAGREVRTQVHPSPGPATLDVHLDAGRVTVHLAPESGPETDPEPGPEADPAATATTAHPGELRVTVEHDPDAAPGWVRGLTGVLGWWLDGGREGTDEQARAAEAVAATTIEWDQGSRALRVSSPPESRLRAVPLAVTVAAPDSSSVRIRAGAATVTVDGRAGDFDVATTGEVSAHDVSGRASLRCGAGRVRLGRVTGRLTVTGGAGGVDVAHVLGSAEITSGAGSVRLREVGGDTAVRAASGNVTIDDATSGDLELSTGAGSLRVGVHPGVDAQVDLRAAAGRATSELPVRTAPPTDPEASEASRRAPLRIRARAAAGDARVGASRL